jgi:hypothetical protein
MSRIRTPIDIERARMKPSLMLFAAACITGLALPAYASCGKHEGHDFSNKRPTHIHETKPVFGGVVAVVNDIDYELVAEADKLVLHVYEHGVPVDLWGASATVELRANNDKVTVSLAPAVVKFEAEGRYNIGPGTLAIATVALPGRSPMKAKFKLR